MPDFPAPLSVPGRASPTSVLPSMIEDPMRLRGTGTHTSSKISLCTLAGDTSSLWRNPSTARIMGVGPHTK